MQMSRPVPDINALRRELEHHASSTLAALEPVQGGDFATAFRCEFVNGEILFAKTHRDPPARFFSTEAMGLEWLRSAGASVPRVISFSDEEPAHLILDWIQPDRGHNDGDTEFGRMLAAVHSAEFPCFGRPDSESTGSLGLPNRPATTWLDHYANQRLVPLARLGSDTDTLPPQLCSSLQRVATNLEAFGPPPELPSLLHGDLWAGNRVIGSPGKSWLVDPAAFGGHREYDLAMMRLFGGYGTHCFRSYEEVKPLAEGWESRVGLHQLAPLAVHAIKFGGHYVGALARMLSTYQ